MELPLEPQEVAQAWISEFWPPRAVAEYMPIVLIYPVLGGLLEQPQDTHTTPMATCARTIYTSWCTMVAVR